MTKIAAQCTRHCTALVLRNFPLHFLSFLISCNCNVNPSLLPDLCLCLCNPLSLLIVAEYYFLLTGSSAYAAYSLSLSCIQLLLLDLCLWILNLLFLPYPSNISLPWFFLGYFFPFPLLVPYLLFVAACHIIFSPFLLSLCSHFVDYCVIFSVTSKEVTSFSYLFLYTLSLRVLPLGGKHKGFLQYSPDPDDH